MKAFGYDESSGLPDFSQTYEAYHFHLLDDNEITLDTARGRSIGDSGFREVAVDSEKTTILVPVVQGEFAHSDGRYKP